MYTAYEETTKWECDIKVPNHTYYLLKNGKCAGYKKAGTNEITLFKQPFPFDKRYRTFKKIGTLSQI